jgi:hypothetical protein
MPFLARFWRYCVGLNDLHHNVPEHTQDCHDIQPQSRTSPSYRDRTSWRRRRSGRICRRGNFIHGTAIGPCDNVYFSRGVARHEESPFAIPCKPNRSKTVVGTFRIVLVLHDRNHSRSAVGGSSWHTVAEPNHKKKVPVRIIAVPVG